MACKSLITGKEDINIEKMNKQFEKDAILDARFSGNQKHLLKLIYLQVKVKSFLRRNHTKDERMKTKKKSTYSRVSSKEEKEEKEVKERIIVEEDNDNNDNISNNVSVNNGYGNENIVGKKEQMEALKLVGGIITGNNNLMNIQVSNVGNIINAIYTNNPGNVNVTTQINQINQQISKAPPIQNIISIKYENKSNDIDRSVDDSVDRSLAVSKNDSKSHLKSFEEENNDKFLIPTVKVELAEKGLFGRDPFLKNIHKNSIENDPRNPPYDKTRKKYKKITEEKCSYEGEWKNGKRDGFGTMIWGEGYKLQGIFKANKISGYGKMWKISGDFYRGHWKECKFDGCGIYTTVKGVSFRGEWKMDMQWGFGMEKWPRGSNFVGEYMRGNKEGIGILNFENRARYEGEFKDGIISGIGTFNFGKDRKYKGEWLNNKMHGYGYITWADGNYFEGEFVEDKKEGFGVFYTKNKVFIGFWKNNNLEGKVIIIDDGNIKKQQWKHGRAYKNLPLNEVLPFDNLAKKLSENKAKQTKEEEPPN